ncbi:MAG: hypothetical protein KKB45_04170 [Gammaproteobacteria bacterium]|nr:hypothetical protein [Gammaproteobacteria bacterium]
MTDFYMLVCQTAAQLQAEGKTPSLALVRARAGKGLDASALFSAYQLWRSNPPAQILSPEQATETKTEFDFTAAEPEKDTEIKALREEINSLRAKVDQLVLVVEQINLQLSSTNVRR